MPNEAFMPGGFSPCERQLDLEDLLFDLGDVVDFVEPYFAAGPLSLEAVRADPLEQVVVDHREDAGGTAAAHRGDDLDFGKVQVLRRHRNLGWPLGDGQGQVNRDVAALVIFVKDHEGARHLG
jgi:hypothetical protein